MRAEILPLLLASDQFASESEAEPLDRLRMQKGVFLLEMRGPAGWRDLYRFRPYDWGPYSRELAGAVIELQIKGLLEQEPIRYRRYDRYRTTPEGEALLEGVALSEPQRNLVSRVRAYVTSRPFTELLREVYAAYPAYATASRFSG